MMTGRLSQEALMTPLFRKILGMNWVLILTMYGLLIFGVFAIESGARHLDQANGIPGGEFFAGRQKLWIALGSVVYFGAALVDYRWVRWLGVPMYVVGLALTVKAMGSGDSAHRLMLGPISFQPAQSAIAAGIIAIATLAQDLPRVHRFFGEPFFRVLLIGVLTGIPFLLVVKLGDMGSALVWIPVAVVIMLVSGIPWRYLIFLGAMSVGLVPIGYYVVLPTASERGTKRIETYLESVSTGVVENTDAHSWSLLGVHRGWQGGLEGNGGIWSDRGKPVDSRQETHSMDDGPQRLHFCGDCGGTRISGGLAAGDSLCPLVDPVSLYCFLQQGSGGENYRRRGCRAVLCPHV